MAPFDIRRLFDDLQHYLFYVHLTPCGAPSLEAITVEFHYFCIIIPKFKYKKTCKFLINNTHQIDIRRIECWVWSKCFDRFIIMTFRAQFACVWLCSCSSLLFDAGFYLQMKYFLCIFGNPTAFLCKSRFMLLFPVGSTTVSILSYMIFDLRNVSFMQYGCSNFHFFQAFYIRSPIVCDYE